MFRPLKSYEKSLYLEYFDLKDNNVLNLKKDLTKIKENILIPKGFNVVINPDNLFFLKIIVLYSHYQIGMLDI